MDSPRCICVLTVANCAQGDESLFAENQKATLEPVGLDDGINWAMLRALWHDVEAADVNAAKRDAFISWVRKLR